MLAYRLQSLDTPPVLTDCPVPAPASGEVQIAVGACGLNFADTLMIRGKYQDMPDPPMTLGMEVAGTVTAVGEDVAGFAEGDRVAAYAGHGGMAEIASVPASRCLQIPASMSFEQAAAFQITYGSAHLALVHRARLAAGETVLVLGAAGGAGLTAVEVAKACGATVIASARGPDKLGVAEATGADHLIDSDQDPDALKAAFKGFGGLDVVYDTIGEPLFTPALRACAPEGRYLPIGFAGGEVPQIPANILLVKNIDVIGFWWGGYLKFAPEILTGSLQELLTWFEEGRIRPHISHSLPLSRADEALDLIRSRTSTGKVVVTP